MAGYTVVMVRAGEVVFAVMTSFARIPAPGEHVLVWLSDSQRARLGAEFGFGKSNLCVPAIVRDTVLRQEDQWRMNMPGRWSQSDMTVDHVADVFADAITTEAWKAKSTRWASGEDLA